MNEQAVMPGMATNPEVAMKVLEAEIRAKKKKKSKTANAAEEFGRQIARYNLPPCIRELKFAKGQILPDFPEGRLWRFDYAFPDYKLAVEIEGLVVRRILTAELDGTSPIVEDGRVTNVKSVEYTTVAMGGHATITGIREDMEKYTNARYLGWDVLRFEQGCIANKYALKWTMRILSLKGWTQPI